MTSQACIPRTEQPVGPHLASGLQGVNLAPVWGGVEVRGGLGTSSKLPGCGEQWGHCGKRGGSRLAGTAAYTTGRPNPWPPQPLLSQVSRGRDPPSPHRLPVPNSAPAAPEELGLCLCSHPDSDPPGSRACGQAGGVGVGRTGQDVLSSCRTTGRPYGVASVNPGPLAKESLGH